MYFFRESSVVDDDTFKGLICRYFDTVHERPIYIYKGADSGELKCSFVFRSDCKLKKQIGGITVMYREPDIDFNDETVLGFVKLCHAESKNHNVVCYIKDRSGLNDFDIKENLTLREFFAKYCHK
jgi:hypothetical protein